ncbi:hypothetical protein [Helicobacter pullorum]|uniref:hypothetical protein n=1 Tax=Helicobacter pullorum TaxID=35818 RepID=UPI00242A5B9D|nr:hypothetical protein [Helicobacter pullorum]
MNNICYVKIGNLPVLEDYKIISRIVKKDINILFVKDFYCEEFFELLKDFAIVRGGGGGDYCL